MDIRHGNDSHQARKKIRDRVPYGEDIGVKYLAGFPPLYQNDLDVNGEKIWIAYNVIRNEVQIGNKDITLGREYRHRLFIVQTWISATYRLAWLNGLVQPVEGDWWENPFTKRRVTGITPEYYLDRVSMYPELVSERMRWELHRQRGI